MARTIVSFCDTLKLARENIAIPIQDGHSVALLAVSDSFQSIVYRAFELVDFYRRVPKYFGQSSGSRSTRRYSTKLDEEAKYIATICNGLKHNDCTLKPVICRYSNGDTAMGVSFYSFDSGAYRCRDIGTISRMISYESSLIRIVRSILMLDHIASDYVRSLKQEECDQLSMPPYCMPYRSVFRDLAKLDVVGFPMEWVFGKCVVKDLGDNFEFEMHFDRNVWHGPFTLEFHAIIFRPDQTFFEPFDVLNINIRPDRDLQKFDHMHMMFKFNYSCLSYDDGKWKAELGSSADSVNVGLNYTE